MSLHEFASHPAFEVLAPACQSAPIVLNSPHSGKIYPAEFLALSRLGAQVLRRSEDAFVDELFDFSPALGLPLLKANFPRAFLDVNREANELDPTMFDGPLPMPVNARSLRVAGGLGTIPRVVSEGQPIYAARLPASEADRRIKGLYRPYHRELAGLLDETHRNFGKVVLVDVHSMPSNPYSPPVGVPIRADIILGDRFGTSCSPEFVRLIEQNLQGVGLRVIRNKPYAGGYITETYGQPGDDCHAIQIEINRNLYMNEQTLEKRASFSTLRHYLEKMVAELAEFVGGRPLSLDQAAE